MSGRRWSDTNLTFSYVVRDGMRIRYVGRRHEREAVFPTRFVGSIDPYNSKLGKTRPWALNCAKERSLNLEFQVINASVLCCKHTWHHINRHQTVLGTPELFIPSWGTIYSLFLCRVFILVLVFSSSFVLALWSSHPIRWERLLKYFDSLSKCFIISEVRVRVGHLTLIKTINGSFLC